MTRTLPILTFLIFILSTFLVQYYASPGIPILIRFLTIISFWLGFMGIVLLPIDLSRTQFTYSSEKDEDFDDTQIEDQTIEVNSTYVPWLITYWSTFILAWVILPFVREVLFSGYFTLFARVKMAAKLSLTNYIINFVALIICIAVLAIYLKSVHLVPILMAIGNTYGLLLVTLLLGYGLVDVPRTMWRKSMPESELRRSHIMAAAADEALFEAVWELQDSEFAIDKAIDLWKASNQNDSSKNSHPFEKMSIEECVNELERQRNSTSVLDDELQSRRASRPSQNQQYEDDSENEDSIPTIDDLALLSARLKLAQANLISAEQKWNLIVENNAMYSSLVNGEITYPKREEGPLSLTVIEKFQSLKNYYCDAIYYVWMTYMRCCTYRSLGLFTACLSAILLWSETTMAIPFNLSPFALTLRIFDEEGLESGVFFKISALIPLLYMSACVYTSFFKVSLFGPNCLRGSKQSPGVALIFNAQYLIRMQFPLGYNYLNMLKIDTSSTNCAFSKVMSDMSTVPFFGTSFSFYAPLLILALSYFTLANGYPRILSMLGVDHEDAILLGDRETLDSQVNEGMVLLSRTHKRQQSKNICDSDKRDVDSNVNNKWINNVIV